MANATGLPKLAMLELMMIPVLTHRNEIPMWIYVKAGQNWTIKLYIWVPHSILHTVM